MTERIIDSIQGWRILAEKDWRSVGEKALHIVGENRWRIIARKLTTMLLDIFHARAIARLDNPASFSLRISQILRTVNRSWVMLVSVLLSG